MNYANKKKGKEGEGEERGALLKMGKRQNVKGEE